MNKEMLQTIETVSNEKGVAPEIIFEALELALATAAKKKYSDEVELRVQINHETGEFETFRYWDVLGDDDEIEFPEAQLTVAQAKEKDPSLEAGDSYQIPVDSVESGRIASQTARQVIIQKVREAEREQVLEAYRPRVGELVNGQVKKVTREAVIVDLGNNAEALLPRDHWVPREVFRVGDRLRALLLEVRPEARGPQLMLSRTASAMLTELFKIEVPEIADGVIVIVAAAREPGSRAKIAVKTNDGRIDPIGACVGMRGSRVQAVSGELGNERIDIVPWDENVAQFAINAMSTAEVISIVVDEETRAMDIAIAEENLAQAIGRGGQNVKLASELTGWELNIMAEEEALNKQEAEANAIMEHFMTALDVDEDVAVVLVEENFTTLDEIAYVPLEEMTAIEGFDEEIVEELRARANNALVLRELANEEQLDGKEPAQDLLEMEGMDRRLAYRLAAMGVVTMDDLAECATDELAEIEDLTPERAGELIMTARAPWFEDEDDEEATSDET